MKWGLTIGVLIIAILGCSWWLLTNKPNSSVPVSSLSDIVRPLDKYTIENLGTRTFSSHIVLDEPIATTAAYTVSKFHFDSDGKKVTGLAHVPAGDGPFPVIVQLRGYVDRSVYQTGMGTAPSARVFAQEGFISLAPDGLGYGESDKPSSDVFEERFQTYTTSLNLLAGIEKWPLADGRIGLWGHSNGGQIALTILEISQRTYPTVLWAPVSRPFPYSILFFTDDIEDHGKALRKVTANFEKDYDVEKYSLTNYLDRITAPIQLHQGGLDGTVPQKWSDDLAVWLKDRGKPISYFVYPGAGHSMEGSWNTVMERNVKFFREEL